MNSQGFFPAPKRVRPLAWLPALSLAALLAFSVAPANSVAATFDDDGPPNVETTFSIGVFKVVVEPSFAPMLSGYPGWRASTRTLTSPVLFDPNTQIGLSPSHVHGDAASVAGVPVGVGPSRTVKLSDYSASPYIVPAAFQSPGLVREVFDELRLLRLTVSGSGAGQPECSNRVAGAGSPAHGVPPAPSIPFGTTIVSAGALTPAALPCLGQVQAMGPAAPDFPARSFFDIFAEINVPPVGGGPTWPGGLFRNNDPLIVENPMLTDFPPRATYIHGISTAVPIYLRDSGPLGSAGTLFGYLTLAGHGVFTNCPNDSDILGFLDEVLGPDGNKPGAPIPQRTLVDRCPPPGGSYASPPGTTPTAFVVPGVGAILIRNFKHSNLTNPIPPPPLNGSAVYQAAGTQLDGEYSLTGGATWIPFTSFGGTTASIQHVADSGATRFFDTEMLSLNLSGGTSPGGSMIRESPTKISLGKTTISPAPGGGFNVSSFFDVFLELSVDGGGSWVPAQASARVELNVPPPTLAPYPAAVLACNPVAYYRFGDAPATLVAANSGSLGAAADGFYTNGATSGAEAPRSPAFVGLESDNTALQLDGVNDFVGTIAGLLNSKPRFTVMGWIRRAADQAARTGLFGQNDIVEFGYINNTTLECWTDNGLDIPAAFPNAEWDHIAIVSDGSPGTMTMYTNGLIAGSRLSTLPANNSFRFNIGGGGIFDVAGNFFNGQMDEVAVFDQALTADKICTLYYTAVASPPKITRDLPASTNFFEGDTVVLCPEFCGTPPFHFQWYFFGNPIPGQTGSCLIISNAAPDAGGSYNVEISNDYGTVSSGFCEVEVQPTQPPIITQQPQSVTRYAGRSATFKVQAIGGMQLTYQWQCGVANIAGATNNMLMLSNAQPANAGGYRAIVGNVAGYATSDVATLTVIVPTPGSYEEWIVRCNPFAYWRLNETSGTVAHDYYGGNDGTYNNVTLGAPGALAGSTDTAAEFNGTSSSVTTVAGLLNNKPKFTMTGWIRRATNQADRTGLFGQNDLVEFGYINNNTLECWTDDGLDLVNPIPNEQWGHVAVVNDGSPGTVTMYANGVAIGSRIGSLPSPNNFTFNIGGGGIFDATGNFFNGRIDEVALFDTALSADKICGLYLTGAGLPLRISIAQGGNIVIDSKPSGTAHDGADFGASWAASNTDGAAVTRNGVMQFVAAESDQITLAADPDFNSTQGAITFWMRSAGTTGAGNSGAILFDRRTDRGDVIVQNDDGTIFVQANGGAGIVNSFSTGAVNNDRWHHVAYVYDQSAAGSITIYIDGVLSGSQANTAAWSWPAAQQIELGRSHDGYWRLYDGALDDFRIYNRTLTAAEVAQIASSGSLVDAAALMVRFNFDEAPIGVTMTWPCGTLQYTDEFLGNGPPTVWTDLPGATSPYSVKPKKSPPRTTAMRFFRLRGPSEP